MVSAQCITQWWDVMGYAEPSQLAGKLILQRCWQTQNNGQTLNWDSRLPHDILNEWTQWTKDVEKVAELELLRYIFEGLESPPKELLLRGFCYGGEKAYGIVINIRFFILKVENIKQDCCLVPQELHQQTSLSPHPGMNWQEPHY